MSAAKRYDARYYERWYRAPKTRVKSDAELGRCVALVLALAEHHLERKVRTVLDVGAGEGRWRAPLKRLRPKLDYRGVDGSAWAVERYGARRNLTELDVADLGTLALARPVDLVVMNDVAQYLDDATLGRAAEAMRTLCAGVIFANAFTAEDDFIGDRRSHVNRTAACYRATFVTAGWRAIGAQCYLAPTLVARAPALELLA